jgi:hypothetical protein
MPIQALFWISLGLCVFSFLLFAYQVVKHVQRASPPAGTPTTGGLGDAQQQSLNIGEALAEMAKLADSFSKAGPMATTASLCIVFSLLALVTSGVVKIGT